MKKISRRNMLKLAAGSAALTALGLTTDAFGKENKRYSSSGGKKKALVIGAHPDDPETGAGGTMILLKQAGYEVVSVYLTHGERGIGGKSNEEAARIRTQECIEACKVMEARPAFLTQIDAGSEITPARYKEMYDLIKAEAPDIVFTHWPIDSHRDHRICSLLVLDAFRQLGYKFPLYYFEVESGFQTMNFRPTNYVDITSVAEQKHKACWCHVSQDMESIYKESHAMMEQFRGAESHVKLAEAFVAHDYNRNIIF
ncbi:MAG: PIG-L family deacetylase [Bacteroidales bacterium]|jgi:LmbE family N-acetylglucosaminyl deacetylase|nr:PIG-L family deacetylase [Bacteroidales bacterium]